MKNAFFDQSRYNIRFEWGLNGVRLLAPSSDVLIIIDVLSFATSVDIVVGNGGVVLPFAGDLETLSGFAREHNALAARSGRDHGAGYSLSPASLVDFPAGGKLVLPSPNGSRLSLATDGIPTFAGCLRNAQAVAEKAGQIGRCISVIAAGERWSDGSLRPAVEDLIGAGAILALLPGTHSPEAALAVAAFRAAEPDLADVLRRCGSGQELIGRGFAADVKLASQLNASLSAPILINGAYTAA